MKDTKKRVNITLPEKSIKDLEHLSMQEFEEVNLSIMIQILIKREIKKKGQKNE
jgi:hypothetical protein